MSRFSLLDLEIKKGRKRAILFGATGLVGGHCLNYLVEHDAYDEVLCFTRTPLVHESKKVVNEVINFEQLEHYADKIHGDDLFLCLGTTKAKAGSNRGLYEVDFSYNYRAAMYAKKNGVSQVSVVSSIGANTDSIFFYTRVKGELEKTILKLGFWSTHIFRPSLLDGDRNELRVKEEIAIGLSKMIDVFTKGGLNNLAPISPKALAQVMINTAQKIEKGVNYYESKQIASMANLEEV